MSSMSGEWQCTECNSLNAVHEDFRDDETGHISECLDCGFMDVYREKTDTGKIIEDYQGHNHYYNNEKYSGMSLADWKKEMDKLGER